MKRVEVLCATMHQFDFSKIKEMNIQSNIILANQADRFSYEEIEFEGNIAKMITTPYRGVGKNRNMAYLHAEGEICLLSDDDVCYVDNYEEKILDAFNEIPDASIIIFNLTTDSERKQKINTSIKRCRPWSKMGYGACRIAFKLEDIKKANIWFTHLFGGGCKYPSGEDSMWLVDAQKKGLKIYVHPLIIGSVNIDQSTWFNGYNEEFFFGKGAFYRAAHPMSLYLWIIYFAIRTQKLTNIPMKDRIKFMQKGAKSYLIGEGFKKNNEID